LFPLLFFLGAPVFTLSGAGSNFDACALSRLLDMRFDRLALIVDPTMRARLFDHGGKVLLLDLVMFNAGRNAS